MKVLGYTMKKNSRFLHLREIVYRIKRRGTYRTNNPGGAITQLGPRAVNRQRPVTVGDMPYIINKSR